MIPTGPSPLVKGSFISSSSAVIISGRQKASVFPEPVKAIPIMSRPEKLGNNLASGLLGRDTGRCLTYATGMPWIWIGVGVRMRFDFRFSSKDFGIFISYKESIRSNLHLEDLTGRAFAYRKVFNGRRDLLSFYQYVIFLPNFLVVFFGSSENIPRSSPPERILA